MSSSTLQSALVAVEQIPEDICMEDWTRRLMKASHEVCAMAGEILDERAEQQTARHQQSSDRARFLEVGQLVFVEKGVQERYIGPDLMCRCDGPFQIIRKTDDFGAVLGDPVTGVEVFEGKRIAMSRMVAYDYPVLSLHRDDEEAAVLFQDPWEVGDMVLYREVTQQGHRLRLGEVKAIHAREETTTVLKWKVVPGEAHGPLARRPWEPLLAVPEQTIANAEVRTKVELDDQVLTVESLEVVRRQEHSDGIALITR